MDQKKYKICPGCGKHNAPNRLECRYCETDLTGVRVTDDSQMIWEQCDGTLSEEPVTKTLVRICDCGTKNPPQARKCKACGEDISDILPTPEDEAEGKSFAYALKSVDGCYSIEIDKPVAVIGREGELWDYLQNKRFVSRKQAKLTVVSGKVFIENLSKTNPTFVNNVALLPDKPTELHDGDEIGLGGKCIQEKRQEDAAYLLFYVKV